MPAHIVHINDREPAGEQLAAAVVAIQAREQVVSVVQVGAQFVIVTNKQQRPATEKRTAR